MFYYGNVYNETRIPIPKADHTQDIAQYKKLEYNKQELFDKPVCWFLEKSPDYARKAYMTSIIFSNLLPKTKTLMLAREPIKQMISYVSNFFEHENRYATLTSSLDESMYNYLNRHYDTGYKDILKECTIFANTFKNISININTNIGVDDDDDDDDVIDKNWITMQYRKFLLKYLYQAVILDNIFAENKKNREEATFETTVIFPAVLLFVYNYDETFGYSNWNQFRLVQFEWLYTQYMNDRLAMIKCWLQTDDEFKFDKSTTDRFNGFDDCPRVFYHDKQYYDHVSSVLDVKATDKENSKSIEQDVGDQYKDFFVNFFKPCNNALFTLVHHRQDILIGQWTNWQY